MKLVFCFDGTWNGRDDEIPSSIRRIHRGAQTAGQVSFYLAGPGNELEHGWLVEKLGGLFGWGTDDIVDEALSILRSVYRHGDTIYVFGFSRGAMVARLFCQAVAKKGVHGFSPPISFLGCFDTVVAFLPFGRAQQGIWHDLHIHDKVLLISHAVAIDETRLAFEPKLMNKRHAVHEVWFKGSHADIGGVFENRGRGDIPLKWMLLQARDRAGLHVTLEQPLAPNDDAPIYIPEGVWRRGPRRVGVMVDDNWSCEKAVLYSTN